MELFDIADEQGVPTGETVERTEAHSRGILHRTAHVWVVRRAGKRWEALMQKRSARKDSFPGRYDTSSSGHIQAGDEPLESALRELREELGIEAEPEDLKPVGTFRIQYEKEFYGKMFRDNEIAFVYVYEKPVSDGDIRLQEEEVERVDWFDLYEVYRARMDHAPKFCVPMDGLDLIMRHLGLLPVNAPTRKSASESRTEMVHIVKSGDLNGAGRLFGGQLLMWIDELAGVTARRHAETEVTTACVDTVQFKAPAYENNMVWMEGKVTYVGTTSMEVCVDSYVLANSGSRTQINRAYVTLVSLDSSGKPAVVPRLRLTNDAEREEYAAGQQRYWLRKKA